MASIHYSKRDCETTDGTTTEIKHLAGAHIMNYQCTKDQ